MTATTATRAEVLDAVERFFATVESEEATEVYVVHVDDADQNVVWFYEVYTDRAGLEAHGASAAITDLRDALNGLLAEPPWLTVATPILAKGI